MFIKIENNLINTSNITHIILAEGKYVDEKNYSLEFYFCGGPPQCYYFKTEKERESLLKWLQTDNVLHVRKEWK